MQRCYRQGIACCVDRLIIFCVLICAQTLDYLLYQTACFLVLSLNKVNNFPFVPGQYVYSNYLKQLSNSRNCLVAMIEAVYKPNLFGALKTYSVDNQLAYVFVLNQMALSLNSHPVAFKASAAAVATVAAAAAATTAAAAAARQSASRCAL